MKEDAADLDSGTGQMWSAPFPSGVRSGVQFATAQFLGAPADALRVKITTDTTEDHHEVNQAAATQVEPRHLADVEASFGCPWHFLLAEKRASASAACKNSLRCAAEWIRRGERYAETWPTTDEKFCHHSGDRFPDSQHKGQAQNSSQEPAPYRYDITSQTAPVYAINSAGTVALTLAEAEKLWAWKHQVLLQEFGDMMAAQANQYEEQLAQAFAGMKERHV